MKPLRIILPLLLFFSITNNAAAQGSRGGGRGGFGGMGGRGGARGGGGQFNGGRRAAGQPGPELKGPVTVTDAQAMFGLSAEQVTQYAQVYDSFMVATKPQRDSANAEQDRMQEALLKRDVAAVQFHREELMTLAKGLKKAQEQFDDRIKKVLTKAQEKEYKSFREKQEEVAKQGGPPGGTGGPGGPGGPGGR